MESAIDREKSLKAWKRLWKMQPIETANPAMARPDAGYPMISNTKINGSQLSLG